MRVQHIFLLLGCIVPLSLFAQERVMDTVVISASLRNQLEKETGRNILTIKGDDIRKFPVNTLDDLLKYLPGIEVQQRGPQGAQADIIIRGGTFQQVLVLIDGVRLNDPLTGHFSAYIPLHPSEIDRIEILKGAAAALHGSDAVGGVIHVITKSFSNTDQEKKHAATAGLETGQYGLLNAHGWWRRKTDKTSISIGFFSNKADGQPLRGTTGFFHSSAATLSLRQELGRNWSIALRSAHDKRDFNAQNFYTTFISDTAREKVGSWWHQAQLRKKGEGYQWITDIAYKKLSDEYLYRPGTTPNQNYTQLWVAQSYAQLSAGPSTSLTTGVQFIGKSIRSNDRGNHNLPHGAIFITASHRIKNQLFINESLRLDWDGNYGTVLVPQVNVAWSPSRFTFRGSWGTGIRDADFTERFNNYNKTRVTSGSIGNPDLRTERSQNYELGADYRLLKGLKISAGLFRRAQRDLIDWTPTPYAEMPRQTNLVPGGTYALATNLSRVTTQGAELDLQWRKSIHKGELIWMSGWLWLRSTSTDKTPSFYISSHARFLLTNSVSITQGQFTLSVNTLNKVRNVMASSALNTSLSRTFMLANLRLHYRIPKTGLSIFGQCYNLLNQQYSDLLGAQMPGRWWSAGVNLNR